MVVGDIEIGTDVLVAGAGPAGYTMAIRGAQLGLDVTLVDKHELGGVCLHKGCIPVKTLLHVFRLANDCKSASKMGINAGGLSIDIKKVHEWKDSVIKRLEMGIRELCKDTGVQLLEGSCSFSSASKASIFGPSGTQHVVFKRAVIAIASLLAAQGKRLTVLHKSKRILASMDDELIGPVMDRFKEKGVNVYSTPSWTVKISGEKVTVEFGHDGAKDTITADKLVPAIGMLANTDGLGLENTGVKTDRGGFVRTGEDYGTDNPAFYAIGDVRDHHCNAGRAFREGVSLANILAGKPGYPNVIAMPYTISTDPEIASSGFTEADARRAGIGVVAGMAPFKANGKAVTMGNTDGLVKVIAEKSSHRILGIHIVGPDAYDLIEEGVLAIEMGARLEDVVLTLHPHPTLSEAVKEACTAALEIGRKRPGLMLPQTGRLSGEIARNKKPGNEHQGAYQVKTAR